MLQALRIVHCLESLYLFELNITIKILQKTVRNGLIIQRYADIEIAWKIIDIELIGHFIATQIKVCILKGFVAPYSNIQWHGTLIKTLRGQSIIFQILCSTKQGVGYVAIRIAHYGFIDLHLIHCSNRQTAGFKRFLRQISYNCPPIFLF